MDPYVCVHGVGPDGICEACCERDTCPHDELVCGECYRVFDAKLKAAEARAEKAEAELSEARRQLGEVTQERDALRAGKWAGAWGQYRGEDDPDENGGWSRRMPGNMDAALIIAGDDGIGFLALDPRDFMNYLRDERGHSLHTASSIDAAKAAADAHLVAAGWYLEGGPFTPAPQHPAPGGEDPGKMGTP